LSDPCTRCEARLETPLVCLSCRQLVPLDRSPNPYAAFGLEPVYAVDQAALRKKQLQLSRLVHPDFFGGADPELRRLAEDNTAELNHAYELLSDDALRADWLVRALGGPGQDDERQMPQEFLMEVLEWNEALEEARPSGAHSDKRKQLIPLRGELRERRAALLEEIASGLTPLPEQGAPALRSVRKKLNAVRYIDRALKEIGELVLFCTPR
jgi:molecular chaperone HscB